MNRVKFGDVTSDRENEIAETKPTQHSSLVLSIQAAALTDSIQYRS
jgi:hypothetical protein